jgi:DNA mismatch endonuclease (patch repair protein)
MRERGEYVGSMVDVHSSAQRSYNMSRIRPIDTKPEMVLRRSIHARGFRYRLHAKSLPGKPDLVFPSRRAVVFVNGCFWHSHKCRWGNVVPTTNAQFWSRKREATVLRDEIKRRELIALGWRVLTVWECELKSPGEAVDRVVAFLDA